MNLGNEKFSVLVVEDSESMAALCKAYLDSAGYNTRICSTGAEALAVLRENPPKLLLQDVQLPDMSGLHILRIVQEESLPTTVIIMTAHGSVNTAVEAMRNGAFDFIEKPFNRDRLLVTAGNALSQRSLLETVQVYQEEFDRSEYCDFVGNSLAMQVVYRIIDSAATSKATVFVTGESGTGKELCAQAIHSKGNRSGAPFIALNCAAIPGELFESEIFGHVRGAFTGATSNRKGAAELADGGTLFLDEVCEMDLGLQAKLLRFIQTGDFAPVGSTQTRSVDVRFVCATNRDPLQEIAAGRFREDLYYRLNVVPIMLPPLRDREQDVLQITEKILHDSNLAEGKLFMHLDPAVERAFLQYEWPGNIRELQNVICNAVIMNDGEFLALEMMPDVFRNQSVIARPHGYPADNHAESAIAEANAATPRDIEPLWKVERRAIEHAIDTCKGNVPVAAAFLRVSPSTLYRKKKTWAEIAQTQ